MWTIAGARMRKCKLIIVTMLLLLLTVTGCAGNSTGAIGQAAGNKPGIVEDEYLLFVETSSENYSGDLYLKKGINEKEKLSSDVQNYSYEFYPLKELTVFLDKDNNLYIKEIGKEKELISAEATFNYTLFGDESGMIFLKSDNELYQKIWGQEKEKISSDVMSFNLTADGKVICFNDYEGNLYIKKDDVEKEKLASNVMSFNLSDNGSIIYYLNEDGDLYKRDWSKPDNEKITTGDIQEFQVSADGNMITYLNEYNYEKFKGELYFISNGEAPKKIGSDVTYYEVCDGGKLIYYLNEEKNLLSAVPGKEEKTKISGDINYFTTTNEGKMVVFENTEGALYLNPINGEKEKIGDSLKAWNILNDNNIVYLTEDTELYIKEQGKEKVKLATDVQNYVISDRDNSISYYTKDYQMYLKSVAGEAAVVVDNVRDYNYITFSDSLLFEKKLLLDDIKGIWYANRDGEEVIFEINNDYKINIYESGENILTCPVKLENSYGNYGDLMIEDTTNYYSNSPFYIEYISESEMIMDGTSFMKIEKNGLDAKLQAQKAAFEEQQKAEALQYKIDAAWNTAYDILYTYQYVTVDVANYRESPATDANIIGTINMGNEFYIEDTYVDETGEIWCYFGAYDENNNYLTGWCAFSNFQ
jgi:hypothetical protein